MNDQLLINLFIAFRAEHHTSLDKMLTDPDLRQPFLQTAYQTFGPVLEKDVLERLVSLRKNRRLPPASKSTST
jgi:hypothetical protein